MAKSWEIQPGLGEDILEDMGEVVRERKKLGPSTPDMKFLAGIHYWSVDLLIARRVPEITSLMASHDAEPVSLRLSPEEYEQYVKAEQLATRIKRAEELEGIRYLDAGQNWRVRLEPFESGVVQWRASGGAGGGSGGKSRLLERGEVMEGRNGTIGAIDSVPAIGGELIMDFEGEERFLPLRKGIHVTGLVSPETGEPQADLQILEKTT